VGQAAQERGVLEARVFGSWARGTQSRRSDLDVLIIEHTAEPFLARIEEWLLPLVRASGVAAVEVLVYTPGELEAMKGRPFIRRILEEGVVVYRREPAVAKEPASP